MSVDVLVSRLERVKRTGPDRWLAMCPAHEDRKASLSIRELDDGRVLVHDFAGCKVDAVLAAVDLTFDSLFPESLTGHRHTPERRPFPAADVLRALAFEALVVMCAASAMSRGEPLSEDERARLVLAVSRFEAALRETGHA